MADLSEDDLLNLVFQERRNSVGLDNDAVLTGASIYSLDYYKGEMPDVPNYEGRSSAVSTDVADVIETALPDLVEIFTGGEDVASFQPVGPEDEDAAEQETDYVNHVVMVENDGFKILYSAFKDALTVKRGIFKWWWEDDIQPNDETFVATQADFEALQQANLLEDDEVKVVDVEEFADELGDPMVRFTKRKMVNRGGVKIAACPPEDFTVARDTVDLKATTYCAFRSRPRAQDLIEQGYDPDLVSALPPYGAPSYTDAVQQARDTAGEQTQLTAGTWGDLRLVEIIEHNIAVVNDDGEREIWRVVTGNDERSLLHKEKIQRIQFSAITPFPQPHRFYGFSLADKTMEGQRVKTAIQRAYLDSLYFALNQRMEVADAGANEFTINDLLLNEPGVPVRSKTGMAVRPITAGGININAPEALEYFSTVIEARTGIVRNAQGLNPDTLHDTATGAMALMSNAQKRLRMIARIFAETGVKEMFLGVHALIREHPEAKKVARLRGRWVQIDPSSWAERNDMVIEVGIGSGGAQHELQMGQMAAGIVEKLIQAQGGANGPIVTLENIYNLTKRLFAKGLLLKGVDRYLTDPKAAQQQGPQQPPPPDPEMVKAQQAQQMEQAKLQAQQQQAQAKAQADAQLAQAKLAQDLQIEREKMAMNAQLQREQMDRDTALKREEMMLDYQAKLQGARAGFNDMSQVTREPGGDVGGDAG
jgi:hypothetical protein